MQEKIKNVEKKYSRKEPFEFDIGDTVDVHFNVTEGDKKRIQVYNGIVIRKKGTGINSKFTVRRISYGEGVERTFPFQSPLLEKVVVKKKGKVRRSKLYYLRDIKGKKATRVKEKVAKKDSKKEQ